MMIRLFWAAILVAVSCGVDAVPVVSNVRASQRTDGSGLVDIYYDLSGSSELTKVRILISSDDGATWNVTPQSTSLIGAAGACVRNGINQHVVWDAANDRPDVHWPQAQAKVIAEQYTPGPTVVVNLPGTATLELVRVPAGSFAMGSEGDSGWSQPNEQPVHTVTIAYDLWFGKYEVTQGQWKAVMGSSPVAPVLGWGVGDNFPVYQVTWSSVTGGGASFVAKLNDWIIATGQGSPSFRLPSEAEWEYACRAGENSRFFFGNSNCSADTYYFCNLGNYAWFAGNSSSSTHEVGQRIPNDFGLYDILGNVGELCVDAYHNNYTGAPTDGSAWNGGTGSGVLRGGTFGDTPSRCRSAWRYSDTWYNGQIGFRLVRSQ